MTDRIHLPAEFLPCIDDPVRLLVMADWINEHGDLALAQHLRWTAREWEWGRGLRRSELTEGLEVWARYSSSGWSRAAIDQITDRHVWVIFPYRKQRGWTARQVQRAARAWWDLEPRCSALQTIDAMGGTRKRWTGKRPDPRKGYGTQKNAELAAALTGLWPKAKIVTAQPELQRGLFDA